MSHFEDLGLLAPLLQQHGATIDYVDAWNLDQHQVEQADLVVCPDRSVSTTSRIIRSLRDEIALARRRIAENRLSSALAPADHDPGDGRRCPTRFSEGDRMGTD